MPNKAREQVQREINLIIRLQGEGLKKEQIIDQLQISERTYKRYKRRIIAQVVKSWKQENKDIADYRLAQFEQSLEDCYNSNLKIVINTNSSARDIQESSKIMVTCRAQLAKLARDGPVFQPVLPREVVPIETAESTI